MVCRRLRFRLLLRSNQADSLLGDSSSTKIILRFNFAFFSYHNKGFKLSSLLKKEACLEIVDGCHHSISRSAISFPLSSIARSIPYRIMAPYIWIHYSGKSIRMMFNLISLYVYTFCMNSFSLFWTPFQIYTILNHYNHTSIITIIRKSEFKK